MSVPKDLCFTRTHEWIRSADGVVVMGISAHAQDLLGEVVFVELPDAGTEVAAGDELGTLESVKAVAEFFAPITGEVVEVNEALDGEPNLVNDSPFEGGWLVKIKAASDEHDLMDAAAYEAYLQEEAH